MSPALHGGKCQFPRQSMIFKPSHRLPSLPRRGFLLALLIMCLMGCLDLTRGVSAPAMQAEWHLSFPLLGILFSSNAIGYLIGSFLLGLVIDRVSLRGLLILCGGVTVASIALIVTASSYTLLLVAFIGLGLGTGGIEICINGVVPRISDSTQLETKRFNTLHGMYGAGATVFPLVASTLNRQAHSWHASYLWLGLAAGVFTLWSCVDQFQRLKPRHHEESHQPVVQAVSVLPSGSPWKSLVLYCLTFAISVYVMAEAGVASWLPLYLVHSRGMGIVEASWFLTGFYLLFTIGRLSAPLWVHRLGNRVSTLMSAGFALLLLIAALTLHTSPILFAVAGVGFAIIFPTIVALASEAFPKNTGHILGILFTAGGVGSMVTNSFIGFLAGAFGLQIALWALPCMMSLVILSLTLAFAIAARQKHAVHPAEMMPTS